MNEDLDRTRKLQNNFLAIMNHEMRTPLTVIAGYADMIKMKAQMAGSTDEDAIKNLGFIKDEAMRLGRIVEKSEEGIVDYIGYGEKKKVNVSELFEDVSKFCTPICEKRHVTIRTESPDGISVNCYKDEMLQVLYNLVLNASRHSENGEIVLRARQEEEDVLIHVSDNGDGMDDETMKHAFDKGYTKDGGHGIGLALCKDIVLAHNGTIHIEKNTDKGITVCILLLDK
jgi:signal transduction histidine kinase